MPRVKTQEKELAILDAASRVFAARPFHEVLIDTIAADAGIGKGTIYRYFETKEDLYFATVLHVMETLAADLENGDPYRSVGDPPARAHRGADPEQLLGAPVPPAVLPARRAVPDRWKSSSSGGAATDPARRPGSDPGRNRAARVPRHRRPDRRGAVPRHGALDEPLPHTRGPARGRRRAADERVRRRHRRGATRETHSRHGPPRVRRMHGDHREDGAGLGLSGAGAALDAFLAEGRDAAVGRRQDGAGRPRGVPEARHDALARAARRRRRCRRIRRPARPGHFARAAAAKVGSKRSLVLPRTSRSTAIIVREKQPLANGPAGSHVSPDDLRPVDRRVVAPLRLRRPRGRRRGGDARALRRRLDAQRRDPGRRAARSRRPTTST